MLAKLKKGAVFFREKLLTPLVFVAFAVLYFTCLPYTIQHLDSAEIGTKGYLFNVVHPPGYPLQNWLNFIFTHLIPWKTVFWRSALLTMLFSLGTLYLVYATIHKMAAHWTNVLWIIPLGLFPVYYEYSVIPDVFMLHCFLCAGLLHFYLAYPHTPRNVFIMTMFGALGACHHHTIIFLFPLLLHAHLKMPLKVWLIDLGCSLMLMFAFYTSIFMMHPEAPYSWGLVNNWHALWRHFIRADFGTFNLVEQTSAHAANFSLFLPQLKAFLGEIFYFIPLIFVAALIPVIFLKRKTINPCWITLFFSFLIYLICFIGSLNTIPELPVVSRFYILPFILLFFLSFLSVRDYFLEHHRLLALLTITMLLIPCFNLKNNYQEHNYSHNTIIEDYIINFINYIPVDKPTVVFMTEDSSIFAFQYVNATQTKRKDLTFFYTFPFFPLPNQWVKHPKIFQEIIIPPFVLANYKAMLRLDEDVLGPNLKKFNFATTSSISTKKFKTIYLPVGRVFTEGKGEDWIPVKDLVHRHDPRILATSYSFQTSLWIFAAYAYYYLQRGMQELNQYRFAAAEHSFQAALKKVPYCIPAMENICHLKAMQMTMHHDSSSKGQAELKSCYDLVAIMKNINYDYFAHPF